MLTNDEGMQLMTLVIMSFGTDLEWAHVIKSSSIN